MLRLSRRNLRNILVGSVVGVVLVASYVSVLIFTPPSDLPTAFWDVDQLVISFNATDTGAFGSATASVACGASAGYLQFHLWESNPVKLKLSIQPTGLSCGSSPSSVTVSATCLVPAGECKGSFTGFVQPQLVGGYRNVSNILRVLVNVISSAFDTGPLT